MTNNPRDTAEKPVTRPEKDAVRRVLRHLLSHCLAAAERLAPTARRFTERGPLPQFDTDENAQAWFVAEATSLLDAQRLALAMKEFSHTVQFAEALDPLLVATDRHEELLVVLERAKFAARQLRHPMHGTLFARTAAALIALGRPEEALQPGKEAQALAEMGRDERSLFDAHLVLGLAHRAEGTHEQAAARLRAAWEIGTRLSTTVPDAHVLLDRVATELTITYLATDDVAVATRKLARDLRCRRRMAAARVALVHAQMSPHSPNALTSPADAPHTVPGDSATVREIE
ncbi:MAG TPA: hypothetical protein VNO31_31325 [Umezawaea sp.]|nr:hypothetical protein [Umezawaea sp.]